MPEDNEKPRVNLLDQNNNNQADQNPLDALRPANEPPQKKPNIISRALGAVGIATAATIAVGGSESVIRTATPVSPAKTAANLGIQAKDFLVDKLDGKQDQPAKDRTTPTGEIGSAPSVEKTDLADLNQIYDTFVNDLSKIPGAIMMGMGKNLEGFKVAVGENTYKFIRPSNQTDEKTLVVENDHQTTTVTIKDGQITKDVQPKDSSTNQTDTTSNISANTARELNQAYSAWLVQRGISGENTTPPTQAVPAAQTPITEPSPTNTPEPTSTPQPLQIDPFDRGPHKAIDNSQTNDNESA